MAKPKVSNIEIRTYLQERKKSLKKELEQVEKVLNSIDADEKPSDKKGKQKNKKKLEKAVKAIRKRITEAIEGAKNQAESLVDSLSSSNTGEADVAIESTSTKKKTPSKRVVEPAPETASVTEIKQEPAKRTRKPRVVDKPASASAVTTVPAVVTEEKKPVRRKAVAKKAVGEHAADEPKITKERGAKSIPSTFEPGGTMDEKIRYALGQKRNSTKDELIEYLNGLEPDYGLSKLRKVVAFRLNHLLKTGKIKGKESKAGIRYAN